MKKSLLSLAFIGLSVLSYAQVGIGTDVPKSTLHVVGKPTDTTTTDGIIAPIITRTELIAKNSLYTTAQTGAIVYVNEATGTADTTPKAAEVTDPGYYYFDGAKWTKFSSVAANEPWNVQATANGATANTDNIYQQGNVAIGTKSTDPARNEKLYTNGQVLMEELGTDANAGVMTSLFQGNFYTESYLRDTGATYSNQKGRAYVAADASLASEYRPYVELFAGNAMETATATNDNNITGTYTIDSNVTNLGSGYGVHNLVATQFGADNSTYAQGKNSILTVDANGVKIGSIQDGLNTQQPFHYKGNFGIDGQTYVNGYYLPKTSPSTGQVLMFDSVETIPGGTTTTKTKWDTPTASTASNGVTKVVNDVQLGGVLTQPTTITASTANQLTITNSNTSDINTGLVLPHGGAEGLKLTSDANGNAYWNKNNVVFGTLPAAGGNVANFGTQTYTGATIALTKGKWIIDIGAYVGLHTYDGTTFTATSATTNVANSVINTDSTIWCSLSLSSSSTTYTAIDKDSLNGLIEGSGRAGAGNLSRGTRSVQIIGKMAVNVTTTTNQNYYVWSVCNNYGASVGTFRPGNIFGPGWERWFYATPL